MALRVVADIDDHPGTEAGVLLPAIGVRLRAPEHRLDVVLPGAGLLVVLALDGADVVRRVAGDRVPGAGFRRRFGEEALGVDLAHGVSRALQVLEALGHLVRIAVLVCAAAALSFFKNVKGAAALTTAAHPPG